MATALFNTTNLLSVISNSDATTGWNAGTLDPDIKVQGTNALSIVYRNGGTSTFTFPTARDMSALGTHIRLWFSHSFPSYLQSKALGGIRLFVIGGGTNVYYVGGSDTHNGAWQLLQADLSSPTVNGNANLSAITAFGFTIVHSAATRNIINTWWDLSTHATGLSVYGGTTSDRVRWNDIAIADTGLLTSAQYGLTEWVRQGAYYLNLGLYLGSTTAGHNAWINGTNETVIFYSAGEKPDSHYLIGTGNATGVTHIDLSNSVFKSSGTPFLIDMTSTNVTSFMMKNSTIGNAKSAIFKTGQDISGTTFSGCGPITTGGATMSGGAISNTTALTSTGSLVLVNSTDIAQLSDVQFTNYLGKYAIYIPATITGTITFDGLEFDGSGTDVYWAGTTGTLTVALANGSNATTFASAGGTVTFENSVTLSLNNIRENVEVRIYRASDRLELAGAEDHTQMTFSRTEGGVNYYTFSYSYNAGLLNGTAVYIQIVSLQYQMQRINYTLGGLNASIPIQFQIDRNFSNPI